MTKQSLPKRPTALQIRMARAGANLTIRQLAQLAGLNKATIVRIEAGMPAKISSYQAITKALEERGAHFHSLEEGEKVAVSFPSRDIPPEIEENMHLIVYTSKIAAETKSAPETIADIINTAKPYNSDHKITGVLLFENGYFLQALEGKAEDVEDLYKRIESDPRHKDLVLLVHEDVAVRSFSSWSMDSFKIENSQLFDPQIIGVIKKLYYREFELNSKLLIEFIKKVIDEVDDFKIANETLAKLK